MSSQRYIEPLVLTDLGRKMVFIAGPRQSGKTTFAEDLAQRNFPKRHLYLNWDAPRDRKRILAQDWDAATELIILDELHKYARWKSWLKGVYDTSKTRHKFIVTGSARMDVYRRGGDSMLGRYHLWRLHPLSLQEVPAGIPINMALSRLMQFGGFPEPFLANDARFARRWRTDRYERVLHDDIRDLERIEQLTQLEALVEQLRTRVASPIVAASLARDLEVAPRTVQRWLAVLERMYLCFVVQPYSGKLSRTLSKPPKVYFYDNGDVLGDEGARFENLVATHLLKRIQFLQDSEGYKYELRYIRDKEGREADFVVLKDGKVDELWEAKLTDASPSPHLRYFAERIKPRRVYQVVHAEVPTRWHDNICVVAASRILSSLAEVPLVLPANRP